MIRRIFLKAAVAFAMGCEHFKPLRAGYSVDLEAAPVPEVDTQDERFSPVIHALRGWNDLRTREVALLREAGFTPAEANSFLEEAQVKFTIRSNRLAARSVSAAEMERRDLLEKI